MKTMHKSQISVVMAVILLGLGGYAGMSTQEKNTAIGAGVGAVGGASIRRRHRPRSQQRADAALDQLTR